MTKYVTPEKALSEIVYLYLTEKKPIMISDNLYKKMQTIYECHDYTLLDYKNKGGKSFYQKLENGYIFAYIEESIEYCETWHLVYDVMDQRVQEDLKDAIYLDCK